MADDDNESSTKMISITVKTPKEKHTFEVESTSTVLQFKEKISETFKASVSQLCLIFAGKILKDPDALASAGIKDGLTIHLVIKANKPPASAATTSLPASATSTNTSTPNPTPSSNPFSMFGGEGIGGLGGANISDVQSQLLRNPESMRQMMENPLIQNIMSNPEMVRMMITSNPQMRELMERNPELNSMLNNPALMRQAVEMMRNPAAMQEMMRQQDRAMSNLESIPGGMNHLQRIYRDIQEPLMNASAATRPNPFADLANTNQSESNPQQGMENNQPLPNPWGPSTPATRSTNETMSSPAATSGTTGTTTTGGASTLGGMFNSPGMQSYMQQMMSNPQMMQNVMNAPYMQSMLQNMQANPEMMRTMLANNPLLANNPQMQESLASQLPAMMQQMQNPAVQQAMTNPRVAQALMQIQQGMALLQQEAPEMLTAGGMMGIPPMASTATTPITTATGTTPATTESTTTANQDTTLASTLPSNTPTSTANTQDFSNIMAQMMQMMGGNNTAQSPEQRFAPQLEQLANMGFVDRQANIQALLSTMGDVNAAIERLLQQG